MDILIELGMDKKEAKRQLAEGDIDLENVRDNVTDATIISLTSVIQRTLGKRKMKWDVRKNRNGTSRRWKSSRAKKKLQRLQLREKKKLEMAISLRGCENITDIAVIAIAENFPGLTTIDLSHCVNITDTAVIAIAENCAGLTRIYLGRCFNITDAAVIALAERCAGL